MRRKKLPFLGLRNNGICVHGRWCGLNCSGPGKPIDAIDRCCKKHDECYDKYGRFNSSCDKELMRCLKSHINPRTKKGRIAASIYSFFYAKTLIE